MPYIEYADRILRDLIPPKRWMTAQGLANKMREDFQIEVVTDDLLEALIAHANDPRRVIRYSVYPSRRTLDILWGHICVVGDRKSLPNLLRLDGPDQRPACPQNSHRVFVSHNSRDFEKVAELCERLPDRYQGWLYEAEIPTHGRIIDHVREAVSCSDWLIVYLSRNSIGSLWVDKELEQVQRNQSQHGLVVIDGADEDIRTLFAQWRNGYNKNAELFKAYATKFGRDDSRSKWWTDRCKTFLDRLDVYLGSDQRVYLHPWPEGLEIPEGSELKFATLDDLSCMLVSHDAG